MADAVTLTVTITDLPNADPELVRLDVERIIRDHIRAEVDTASVEVDLAPASDDDDVCGLCGVRRPAPGMTACSTCA